MYCPALQLEQAAEVDTCSQDDLTRLKLWCQKSWQSKLKAGLFYRNRMIVYPCCSAFLDKDLVIRGGHPASEALDLFDFLQNHQIASADSLFDSLLGIAVTMKNNGQKMMFPGINRSHSGRKVRLNKHWSHEEELEAAEKRADGIMQRNFALEIIVKKQKVTILDLEREKHLQREKYDSLRDLATVLKARIAILEAAKSTAQPSGDSFIELPDVEDPLVSGQPAKPLTDTTFN